VGGLEVIGVNDDDDLPYSWDKGKRLDGASEKRASGELEEGLADLRTHPLSAPRGEDHCADGHEPAGSAA
jgi:hypothetical protein